MKKPMIIFVSVAFVILGVAAVAAVLYALRPPVPDAKFRQVKPGMSGKAVREILGAPTSISCISNDAALGFSGTNWRAQWTYSRDLPWQSVWVYVMFTNDVVTFTGGDSFP